MPYAVELLFDNKTENYIYDIWKELHRTGLNRYMLDSGGKPHITLSIYKTVDYSNFEKRLKLFFKNVNPFTLTLASIGVFPESRGAVFLALTVTDQLLDIHRRFHDAFGDYDELAWDFYKPGKWVPHCTISVDTNHNTAMKVVDYMVERFRPMDIRIESVVIVKFRPINHLLHVNLPLG